MNMRILLFIIGFAGCITPNSKFGFDSGYAGTAGGFVDADMDDVSGASPGDECSDGGVFDCNLDCWVAEARAYIGDGTCDSGQRGPNFDCELAGFDEGDCSTGGDVDGTPDPTDADGGVAPDDDGTDGDGTSSDDGWSDDGVADDGTADDGASADGTTDDGWSDDGTADAGWSDDGTADDGWSDDGTTDDGWSDDGTADDGWSDDGAGASLVGEECVTDVDWVLYLEEDFWGEVTGYGFYAGTPGYLDCSLVCVPEEHYLDATYSWWGDGFCDDGVAFSADFPPADFACEELEWDMGDCSADAGTGDSGSGSGSSPTAGASCEALTEDGFSMGFGVVDCSGECAIGPWDMVGDTICDDGSESGMYPFYDLFCEEFMFDGDDCI